MLPDHLAELVREAIQRDRRLIDDSGLGVWLGAVQAGGSTTRLNLRWASSLTDKGLKVLATDEAEWAASLVELDLGYCERIADPGMMALAPALHSLRALVLTGCEACGDGSLQAIGRHLPRLERLELELLRRVTDIGVQAVVRGCALSLADLRLGGCSQLSNISTSLIADHCKKSMRRLGLGGLSTLNDVDCEDIGKMSGLTSLDLTACHRISDAGLKQIGLLAGRQLKAHAQWEALPTPQRAATLPPPTLTSLNLGGLTRLSDAAVQKLLARTPHLTSLDLRGCARLSADGLCAVFAGTTAAGVQVSPSLPAPRLSALVLLAVEGATQAVVARIVEARPALKLTR